MNFEILVYTEHATIGFEVDRYELDLVKRMYTQSKSDGGTDNFIVPIDCTDGSNIFIDFKQVYCMTCKRQGETG